MLRSETKSASVPEGTGSKFGSLVFRGFQPQSFSDFRGKIAAVLFTGGCNFRCRFCYNAPLVLEPEKLESISAAEALELLEPRAGFLDAVVVSGGEPTLYEELPEFLRALRAFSFLIGVDTNGTNPDLLSVLVRERLADRIAMDYKAPREKYEEVTGRGDVGKAVAESLSILARATEVDHEIRLTLHPELHSREDVERMAHELAEAGVRDIALQSFRPWNVLDPSLNDLPGWSGEELREFARFFPGRVVVR